MGKAAANYATSASYGTDSGIADAYVIAAVASFQAPTKLFDGMKIRFKPANTNTGASTMNAFSLGIKNIKDQSGADPVAGDLLNTRYVELIWNSSGNYWAIGGFLTNAEVKSIVQPGDFKFGVTTGAASVYALTLTPALAAYTPGLKVIIRANHTNATPGATLNINGNGAIAIRRSDGLPVLANDILLDRLYTLIYYPTNFYLQEMQRGDTDTRGALELGTNAEIRIGTDAERVMPIADLVEHPLCAKAWGTFSSAGTLLENFNITSVNKTGTGVYRVTLAVTMASVNYVIVSAQKNSGGFFGINDHDIVSTTVFDIYSADDSSVANDLPCMFVVFGKKA